MDTDTLSRLFLDPPAAYRPMMFWLWNGDITPAGIEEQIAGRVTTQKQLRRDDDQRRDQCRPCVADFVNGPYRFPARISEQRTVVEAVGHHFL